MTLGNAHGVAYWIRERESIRQKKEAGESPPWTKDTILRTYRFCNVRREDDAVTRWIARNWRDANFADPYLARSLALARMVNWPPTLKRIGYPHEWDTNRIVSEVQAAERLSKAWSSAYIVSTNGISINKALYVVRDVCAGVPAWGVLAQAGRTLQAVWGVLRALNGFGPFMAAQVIADLKNTPGHPLEKAEDWWTWAAPGPGSVRGLRRYFGGDGMPDGTHFLPALQIMADEVTPMLPKEIGPINMQDWQNVMCEFDKYERTRLGQGRPKSFYRPNPDF